MKGISSARWGAYVVVGTIQGFANAHPWLSFVVALRRPFWDPKGAICVALISG
jgi:hypothetical protein